MQRANWSSQALMAAIEAHRPLALSEAASDAAVLVLLLETPVGVPRLVLFKRRDQGRYAGDLCFAGGRREPGDADLTATLRREVEEELGLSADDYRLLGRLDDFRDGRGRLVRPFVAIASEWRFHQRLRLNPTELTRAVYLPLPRLDELRQGQPPGRTSRRQPSYYLPLDGELIWGLSASILAHFLNVVGARGLAVDTGASVPPDTPRDIGDDVIRGSPTPVRA